MSQMDTYNDATVEPYDDDVDDVEPFFRPTVFDVKEELDWVGTAVVLPAQPDEFVCTKCFLLTHIARRVENNVDVCTDCA